MATSRVAGLSHAELGPGDNAVPYLKAGNLDKAAASIANFADGQAENVAPNNARTQGGGSQGGDKGGQGTKSWKEVWGKNMKRWRSSLHAEAGVEAVPGTLSSAQTAPYPKEGEEVKPYPTDVPTDSITKDEALAQPFGI